MQKFAFASLGAIAVAIVSLPTTAVAQSEASSSGSQLGDIVVTAQRRTESVQSVGASIAAVDSVALQSLGVKSANDLVLTTPSLKVNSPFGEGGVPQFSIRGVTIGSFNVNQSRPIALYVDDSIRSLGALEIMPIYDVERVEVLKGPQGSLYGLNAVGGAINIITQRPGFDTEGYLTLGYGNYNRREARGAAQSSIVDGVLAVRAAFTATKQDGYVKNVLPNGQDAQNVDVFSGRIGVRFVPSDRFDSTITFTRTTSDSNGYSVFPTNFGGSVVNPVTGASREGLGYLEERRDLNSFGRSRNTSINFRATYDLDVAKLSSITSYDTGSFVSRNDDDVSEFNATDDTYSITGIRQFYQELRLQSQSTGPFKWLVGASYLRDVGNVSHAYLFFNDAIFNTDPNAPGAFNQGNSGRHAHRNIAGFGRLDFNPTDELHVFGGARYQKDTVRFLNYGSYTGYAPGALDVLTPGTVNLDQRQQAKKVSFEAGADFKPTQGMLLYASFKQGFRGPAANAQVFLSVADANVARPETINTYEAGLKWDISPALRFNAAVFRNDYKNQQYLNDINSTSGFGFTVINAGSSRIDGAEVELKAAPIDGVVLTASGTFLDAKYRSFKLSKRDASGSLVDFDLAGNQILLVPETSLSFGADITLGAAAGGEFKVHADANYQSRMYFEAFNREDLSDGKRLLVNGRLTWGKDDGGLVLGAWVQNLTNKRYGTFGYDSSFYGVIYQNRGIPRTYGADLTYSF